MLNLIWLLLLASSAFSAHSKLRSVYEWKYIDYDWISQEQKNTCIKNKEYNETSIFPSDVEVAPDGRVFISLTGPIGNPVRLATVTNKIGPGGPLLKPYPDWSWHRTGDCNGITSVFRTALDECNRLWVLDTGRLEQTGGKKCNPQLLAFDLNTDKLVQRIVIPNNIAIGRDGKSLLATPIVETEGAFCHKTTVFMADTNGNGLIVWDGMKLVRHMAEVFDPVPEAINFTAGGFTVTWNDSGPVGMSLTPALFPDEPRYLYFRPMASFDMWAVDTRVMTKSTNARRVKFIGTRRLLSSQAVGQAFSSDGALFFGLTKENAVACLNHYRPLIKENVQILEEDPERLIYINGIKVVSPKITKKQEELWLLSNKMNMFLESDLDWNSINYRILKSSVRELIDGTKCDLPSELKDELRRVKDPKTNCNWGNRC